MASATPNRFGSINNAADGSFTNDYAMFLKVWSGEVLSAFDERNVMMALHTVRTIANGKTAQFPVSGKATAAYHTAGTQLLGTNTILEAEKTINVDAPLIADVFVANIDEALSHFDVRSEYSKQLARALSKKCDQQLLRTTLLAARGSATLTGGNGGSTITDAGLENDGETLYNALFDCQQTLDEKDIPQEERYCVLAPARFKLLARYTKIHNKDWGGTGSIADGDVGRIAGIQIIKSNHLPTGVVAGVTGENNTYSGTFTNTMGVVFQREAIGTVKLRDLAMESEYQISRQGTLMLAKYIMGHGILRPDCAIELAKA